MSGTTAPQVNERMAALLAGARAPGSTRSAASSSRAASSQRLIDEDSLRGVTSNPAIFEKAILGSSDYDAELEAMAKRGHVDAARSTARSSSRTSSWRPTCCARSTTRPPASTATSPSRSTPRLARDTEGTLEQARMYWERVDRPNVMIKIPGTTEGVPAIEQAIYEGINVNVTLLFSRRVLRARSPRRTSAALERRHEEGKSVDVHSVASFFVSRVDTEVDKRLDAARPRGPAGQGRPSPTRAPPTPSFKEIFEGERFAALREAGAPVQRPLWASTGVKNPEYPETLYVDELVGARHGEHDADADAAGRRRARRGRPGYRRRGPARVLDDARRRRASTWTT